MQFLDKNKPICHSLLEGKFKSDHEFQALQDEGDPFWFASQKFKRLCRKNGVPSETLRW